MTRPAPDPGGPGETGTATYRIRVAGHLDDHWAATLGGLTLARLDDGTTSLTGPDIDQAQLHGILARIRDLGAPLLTLDSLDRPPGAGPVTIAPSGPAPRTAARPRRSRR